MPPARSRPICALLAPLFSCTHRAEIVCKRVRRTKNAAPKEQLDGAPE